MTTVRLLPGCGSAPPTGRLEQLDDDQADEENLKSFPRALAVAPLAAPLLYWAGALAFALADPNRRHAALQDPLGGLGYILIGGAPIAYAATLVASVPAIWLVRRGGRWTLAALLVLGGLIGLVAALVLRPHLRGELFSIILPPLAGAALGALSAGVFWWLAPRAGNAA